MTEAEEHYKFCVERAEEYLDRGDKNTALASFGSDMRKNEETDKSFIDQSFLYQNELMFGTIESTRRYIRGFNKYNSILEKK